jgi:hypothetical protein
MKTLQQILGLGWDVNSEWGPNLATPLLQQKLEIRMQWSETDQH